MKTSIYENMYNKERYVIQGKQVKKFINGIEYVMVMPENMKREVMIRKDYLKKVNT